MAARFKNDRLPSEVLLQEKGRGNAEKLIEVLQRRKTQAISSQEKIK
jgi:hypothetical protein